MQDELLKMVVEYIPADLEFAILLMDRRIDETKSCQKSFGYFQSQIANQLAGDDLLPFIGLKKKLEVANLTVINHTGPTLALNNIKAQPTATGSVCNLL